MFSNLSRVLCSKHLSLALFDIANLKSILYKKVYRTEIHTLNNEKGFFRLNFIKRYFFSYCFYRVLQRL